MILAAPQLALLPTLETPLQIALLGPPLLLRDDQPYPIARRQSRALLYRIAATPHPVPRDQLCFLLWPDSPETVARRHLTVLLTQLRRALPTPHALVMTDDAVGLNEIFAQADTVAVDAMLVRARREGRLDLLAHALEQYRGPFLHGFSLGSAEFDDWAEGERQVWERRYLDGLTALVEGYAAQGAQSDAIDAAQRYLATDELAEDMHRRLITLYAATGDRAAAVRQFERCAAILDRELGATPLAETRAAFEAARDTPSSNVSNMSSALTLRVQHTALPVPPSTLIGRENEVAEACDLLQRPNLRLLTLCGTGGSGKTRLALEIAWEMREQFADGVVFVPLAPLHDPALVIDAIAQACDIPQTGALPLSTTVSSFLRDKQLLLVLDNLEHVLPAATLVAELLAAAPQLRIMVTSRVLLNLSGEQSFPVPPLPLPDLEHMSGVAALAAQPAISLLLSRARAHSPAFDLSEANASDLAAICVRLDGLPLAIELAAARLKILSPEALLRRLDQRLALLQHGPHDLPERQRTLRATIAWSYRLLNENTQRLFEQVAVFAGGWTLAAAEAICCVDMHNYNVLDGIELLRDSNLIMQMPTLGGEPRFSMLETIREYALECLRERSNEQSVRRRHARTFCRFVELRSLRLCSLNMRGSLDDLDRDYHNLRTALQWSIQSGDYALAARFVCMLRLYWEMRGMIDEGSAWMHQVLPHVDTLPQPLRSRLRVHAGYMIYRQGYILEAMDLAKVAFADEGAAVEEHVSAARLIGLLSLDMEDVVGAQTSFMRAMNIASTYELHDEMTGVELDLGILDLVVGNLDNAEKLLQRSLKRFSETQYYFGMGLTLMPLGFVALLHGEYTKAERHFRDGMQCLLRVRERIFLLYGLLSFASLAACAKQPLHAARLFGAAMHQAEVVNFTFSPRLLDLAQRSVEQIRIASDKGAFHDAFLQGRCLSLDNAVALALATSVDDWRVTSDE